jgi:tetratricopeptide (TPR) repeat protein
MIAGMGWEVRVRAVRPELRNPARRLRAVGSFVVFVAMLVGAGGAGVVAQDDWSITRPSGARTGPRRPGARRTTTVRGGTRPPPPDATSVPELRAATPDPEAARRDAMIVRYRRVLDVDPAAAFARQRLFELVRERDGNLDGLVASLAVEPPTYATRMLLAALASAQGRLVDARALYREAGALRPGAPQPFAALAALARTEGDASAARELYGEALSRARTDADRQEWVRERAALAIEAGDFDAARDDYARLVPQRGSSVYLETEYARALTARGEHARAAAELERVRARMRGDVRALGSLFRDLGRAYRDAGEGAHAITIFEEGLRVVRESGLRRELYELLVETHRRDGRLPELVARLRGARDGVALAVRASVEDELGNDAEALADYRRLLATNPRDVDTRVRVAQLLARSGRLDEVADEYRALLRAVPGEPRFVVELAQLLVQQGRREEALRLAAETSRRHPREPRVHRALAELYTRWREGALAAAEVVLLARLEPRDPTHIVALGTQQLEAGDVSAARATWRRILAVEGDGVRAHTMLAGLYADHDALDEAAAEYEEALRLDPSNLDSLRGLAGVRERLGDAVRAAGLWERVLAVATERAERREARQRLVASWARSRELPRRLLALERAFRAEPPDLDAGRTLAEAWTRATPPRTADAEAVLERLVALAPGDVESLLALERLRTARGDLGGALDVLAKLVEADERRAAAYLQRMAEHALALYRDEDAIAYARRAAERNPDDAAGHRRLGDLYRARQDVARAIAAYRRALELDARLFPTYFDLAELHLAAGRPDDAEALYRRVVRASPDDELVVRAARAAIQIHLGAGTLETLENELLPLALANPQRPVLRRLVVELYQALVSPLALAAQRSDATGGAARETLARIGTRALKPLLEALSDPDPAQKATAVALLGALGNPNAAGPLLAIAESGAEPGLRARALLAFGAVATHTPAHASRLEALAEGAEARLRDLAAWALARIATRAETGALRVLTGHGDPAVRAFAALGLGVAKAAESREALEALLARDASLDVKAAAAWSLGRLGRAESIPILVASLEGGSAVVARAAALGLGGIRDSRARAALARALLGPDPTTRAVATAALAEGDVAAVLPPPSLPLSARAYISQLVQSAVPGVVRPVALEPLVEPLVDAARAALVGPIEHVRGALEALSPGANGPLGVGPLTEEIDAWPEPARSEARAALAVLAQRLLPELREAAGHADPGVRALALGVLARIDAGEFRDALLAALVDPVESVQRAALERVSPSAGAAALDAVIRLARTAGSWSLRVAAVRALGRFVEAERGCVALAEGLRDDDYAFVREAAADALVSARCVAQASVACAAAEDDAESRVRDAATRACAERLVP